MSALCCLSGRSSLIIGANLEIFLFFCANFNVFFIHFLPGLPLADLHSELRDQTRHLLKGFSLLLIDLGFFSGDLNLKIIKNHDLPQKY